MSPMPRKRQIPPIGAIIGNRTVLGFIESDRSENRKIKLQCKCGRIDILHLNAYLRCNSRGHQNSCQECKKLEHGYSRKKSKRKEYKIYIGVIARCCNKNDTQYYAYGSKGIKICKGWRDSFESFIKDMGDINGDKNTIDRIKNKFGYFCGHCDECIENNWPKNCRWATIKEQTHNRSNNVYLEFNGERKIMADWSREYNHNSGTLYYRIFKAKWPIEEALKIPSRE